MTSSSARPGAGPDGYSLIELLIASGVTLIIIASVFGLLHIGQMTFVTQPDAVDLQQRLRVVADSLTRDLIMVGAGFTRGRARGSLLGLFAPLLPYRAGLRDPDAPGSFRTDRVTMFHVPPGAPEATIGDPIMSPVATVRITADAGCEQVNQACGFQSGMPVLVVDDAGRFNAFTVTAVTGNLLDLQLRDPQLAGTFAPGARIGAIAVGIYSLKTDPAAGIHQLLEYDGYRSEQPVSDDIVGMQFEYFGDPAPPTIVRVWSDPDGPWTTYGPKPPAPDEDDLRDAWPAGENCAFRLQGTAHVPRLPALGAADALLVPIGAGLLTDGPWCPDSNTPNRFDADLLRIRRVRVTVRAQAASVSLRAAAGRLFARPGTSRGGGMMVPDGYITFDVTPRNLNARR